MGTPTESRRELREEYLAQRAQQARERPKGEGCLANLAKMILFLILAVAFILAACRRGKAERRLPDRTGSIHINKLL